MSPSTPSTTAVIRSEREHATEELGEAAGPLLRAGDVILLSGDLGAGKTHLTKGIARGLRVAEEITSPTFNLILVHEGRLTLHHVDLYRLDRGDELENIGYYDALDGGGVTVVEWGDRFPEARPDEFVNVRLEIDGDQSRVLTLAGYGTRGLQLADEWAAVARGIPGLAVVGPA